MRTEQKHIILLGFKNTGKSTIGKALAKKLQRPFIDLDQQIELNYQRQTEQRLSCRKIFNRHGEQFFRDCETQALKEAAHSPLAVIALGGGAPLRKENQILIKPHWLVHVTAEPTVVYARILARGIPAYFPANEDPQPFFQRIWNQHQTVYANLADLTVDNTGPLPETVSLILKNWKQQ